MTEKAQKAEEQRPRDEPEKLDLRSHDTAAEKREELLHLFPEARTEDAKIDFDRLRLALGDTVDVGKERYGLAWPGKADCFKAIQTPSLGTLRPCPEESVDFNTTENLIIEGDNLEVLKLLQKSYMGKVKMIYIDPPYNTGNDFIYPDDYAETLQTYLAYTGQVDSDGRKFGTNTDADGRFHSKWLSMMYPRLYLGRQLLSDDGVLLASIDDNEFRSLRTLLDEVFGEANFLCTLVWNKQHSQQQGLFKRYHEYVVVYARNAESIPNIAGGEGEIEAGALKKVSKANPESEFTFPVGVRFDAPDGTTITGIFGNSERVKVVRGRLVAGGGKTAEEVTLAAGWTQKEQMKRYFAGEEVIDSRGQRVIEFFFNSSGKLKCRKERSRITPPTLLPEYGMVSEQTGYIAKLLGSPVFDNPKPVAMVEDFLRWFTREGDLVLDFFAGSCTSCDAVLRSSTGASFLAVQLPEPVDESSDAGKNALALGLKNICDIGRERVRRVIAELKEGNGQQLDLEEASTSDLGFRVFRLDESSFATWQAGLAADAESVSKQLELHVDHIREGRSEQDLLYEVLLKSGFSLTTPIETLALEGKTVYNVAGGDLLVCLDRALTREVIRAMAARQPARVVCLDAGFAGNDQLKANAVQTFKTKGVARFQTV